MGKIKKILFTFICLFTSVITASAFDVGDKFTYSGSIIVDSQGLEWTSGVYYDKKVYQVTADKDGSGPYYVYCMDPGAALPNNFTVKRKLLENKGIDPQDYGILKIIYAENTFGLSDDQFYKAKNIATRIYIGGVLKWTLAASTDYKLGVLANEGYEICKEAQGEDPAVVCPYNPGGVGFAGDKSGSIYKAARELVKIAVKGRAHFGEEEIPKVTAEQAASTIVEQKPLSDGSTEITKLVVAKFLIENFDPDKGEFYYKGAEYDASKVSELGYSFSYGTQLTDYSGSIPTDNLLQNPLFKSQMNGGNLEFYVGFKLVYVDTEESEEESSSGNTSDNCVININVNYEYNDPNLYSGVILYASSDIGMDMASSQRFVLDSTEPIKETLKIIETICDSICDPTLTMPPICEDGQEPDEQGNVEYEFREAYNEGSSKYRIKKCIVKGADAQGNSYKLIDEENANMVADNDYCAVFCKEDYLLNVPYKRQTEAGRYFQIGMAVKGQQDCYTSKLDYKKYKLDVLNAQKDVLDAYNTWRRLYELANFSTQLHESTDHRAPLKTSCSANWSTIKEGQSECTGCSSNSRTYDAGKQDWLFIFQTNDKYVAVVDEEALTITVTNSTHAAERYGKFSYDPGSCSGCDSCTCDPGEVYEDEDGKTGKDGYDEKVPEYQDQAKTAGDDLLEAMQRLKEKVDIYNSCIGNHDNEEYSCAYNDKAFWDMVYSFEPEIKYSYDEPDPTDESISKWISQVQALGADVMTTNDREINSEFCDDDEKCNALGTNGTVEDIFKGNMLNVNTYCDGDVEDDYTCTGTKTSSLGEHSYNKENYWTCILPGDTGTKFGEYSQEYPGYQTAFTCSTMEYKVTNIDWLHKVAVASASYKTPRVYYSIHNSGEIIVNSTWPENSDQVKGLPVGLNTPQNTYFYILSLSNMGKYYATGGDLGRIFSDDPTSLATYAREINGGNSTTTVTKSKFDEVLNEVAANAYACSYDVSQNSCTDSSGKIHTIIECKFGTTDKDWDSCKKRLCPKSTSYCVKEAEAYYVCDKQYVGNGANCTKYGSRAGAIAAASVNYNCCPDCEVECIGSCMFTKDPGNPDSGELNLEFRPISPGNINPNVRPLGYNWNVYNKNVLVAQKAANTIEEIEARANIDVDSADDATIQAIEEYNLKVTMTPDMISWIKKYNSELNSKGGYNSQNTADNTERSLKCYNYILEGYASHNPESPDEDPCEKDGYMRDKSGQCVMSNIFCYSTFIDELQDEFGDKVDAPKRTEAKHEASSNFKVYKSKFGEGITGDIVTNDYWTIYQYIGINAMGCNGTDVNCDKLPDIGPSWK